MKTFGKKSVLLLLPILAVAAGISIWLFFADETRTIPLDSIYSTSGQKKLKEVRDVFGQQTERTEKYVAYPHVLANIWSYRGGA